MKILTRLSLCAAVALAALLAGTPATAGIGVNVDVLWNPDPDDDMQVFLHVSNTAYPLPRERVTAVFHQVPDPYENFPVLAFIAFHGHVDIGTVWAYKRKGYNWVNVMFHFGVKPGLLFVDLPYAPGPPYGKAYGYWRKHGNRMKIEHLTPEDVRYWVHLQSVARYTGTPAAKVFEWRQSGKRFEHIAAGHYREKHGKGPKAKPQEAGFGQGKGKGKGHDKDKP